MEVEKGNQNLPGSSKRTECISGSVEHEHISAIQAFLTLDEMLHTLTVMEATGFIMGI